MIDSTHETRRVHARVVGAAAIAVVLGWSTLAAYTIHAALPTNPIELPFASHVHAENFAQESFKYFTKNPHYPRMLAYVPAGEGRWRSANVSPYASPRNALGLSRGPEAQEQEMKMLARHVRQSDLAPCEGELDACLHRAGVIARVNNDAPRRTLCGSVGIVLRRPTPWAWRNDGVRTDTRVARLEVSCS
ncbi:SdpA family antimicrobial peptide system protein [Polyangium mundeleinium]|uniref:SdpA family antimicrobial peptide system protein n=1 Tax=Polyangium mundeleinium TaxID=2995306 RepID=A0ABT5EJJ1_9BACT|nr:SdpA family antimicrobial peptide system protein [Polyangium mundeleinium]MDC0741951.1 SdpA family antimicrobial peptide system protein [Polyangium mundeleinium]